ncbi:MAG: lipase, partial [Pseudomonadota bacterium]
MKNNYQHCASLISFVILMATAPAVRALPEDCMNLTAPATFLEANGLVCLQKVIVTDQGNTQLFKASLQWLGLDNPGQFKLLSAALDDSSETSSPSFSTDTGVLTLPKVDIPRLFGTERYVVSLMWVKDTDNDSDSDSDSDSVISLFELDKIAVYNNPDYVANV